MWVTHDLEQAQRLGGDIVVLIDGRVAGEQAREQFLAGEWSADPDGLDALDGFDGLDEGSDDG